MTSRKIKLGLIALAVAVAAALIGGAVAGIAAIDRPATFQITGTLVAPKLGPYSGFEPTSDLAPGAPVHVLAGPDHAAVADGTLTLISSSNGASTYRFVIDNVPTGQAPYVVVVGRHQSRPSTEAEARGGISLTATSP